jgi:hypothetical protein
VDDHTTERSTLNAPRRCVYLFEDNQAGDMRRNRLIEPRRIAMNIANLPELTR